MPSLGEQLGWLLLLAIPVACVSWTVTHEELFREIRDFFVDRSQHSPSWAARKFFYLPTCEYCFSHYVTIAAIVLTRFQLLVPGWRGYLLAGFAVVWVANQYMGLFFRLRLGIKDEGVEIKMKEQELGDTDAAVVAARAPKAKVRRLTGS